VQEPCPRCDGSNERDRRHCRPIDARQSYKRACGQRCVRTEGNTAVGMLTERDVVRAIAEHGAAGVNLKVSQLISVPQLVSCGLTDTLEHVRHLMNENHIRHLPVIDNHSLIGVIGIRDIDAAIKNEATVAA
jgi:CBS domain-containing protein